jgi:hypothetical protein
MAEIPTTGELRVRAKRCNYADGIIVKELSEEICLSRFENVVMFGRKTKVS